ncbi:hypothetical protein TNCV_2941751 [Trichonephila clavipes]|nr:hypothetical protein TNCV_2941751 [Trichonephila clavipes]
MFVVDHNFEHHTTVWLSSISISRESTLGSGQEDPTSHPFPPTSREDMRLDENFECHPLPHRNKIFTSIHALSGIRTQVPQHSSQRH